MEAPEPERLVELEGRLDYRFRDRSTLVAALTHASAMEAGVPRAGERLEFLGDAVLELAISDVLTESFPQFTEGQLSKLRAALVRTTSFAAQARELGLNGYLRLGKGEEKTGGREKASILAAAYEAVIAAVFRDSGYEQVRVIVARQFAAAIEHAVADETPDPKTQWQELCQQLYKSAPAYRVVAQSGPDHARRFTVEVLVREEVLARGEGGSKRAAEQEAARHALQLSLNR